MKHRTCTAAAACLLVLLCVAGAPPSIDNVMMPVDRIEQPVLLDRQLESLREAMPNFNSVIVRDPGVAPDYPTLPAMTLKNVTVGQFLRFVEASFAGVQVRQIEGPAESLYAIRIKLEDEAIRRAAEAQERKRVRLFRLNEYINALADEAAAAAGSGAGTGAGSGADPDADAGAAVKNVPREQRIKEATGQVLSLLQAALEQMEDQEPTMVKIHEPTLTLLFKGSEAQQMVLEEALAALQPPGAGIGAAGPNRFYSTMRPGYGQRIVTYDEAGRQIAVHAAPQVPPASSAFRASSPSALDPVVDGATWRSRTQSELDRLLKTKIDAERKYEAEISDLRAKLAEFQRAGAGAAATQPEPPPPPKLKQ